MSAAYEEMLAFIAAQLTDPIDQQFEDDGSVVFVSGDPGEVIVRLTPSVITVAEYSVSWDGPHTPVIEPVEIGLVHWPSISAEAVMRTVKVLIAATREARLAKFTTCDFCLRSTPPELMHDDSLCQSCAKGQHDTIH